MFDENTQNQQTQDVAAAAATPPVPADPVTPDPIAPTNAPDPIAVPSPNPVDTSAPATDASSDTSSYNTTTLPSDGISDSPVNNGDLATIKQQALQNLSPLLDQLDQSPEEKFRTTMMMLQASDDQSLIQSAYETAQKITDEKVKAQALLDVVNEINYFTQQSDSKN